MRLVDFNVQSSIDSSLTGMEIPMAVLEYIKNNDAAIIEGCEKVSAGGKIGISCCRTRVCVCVCPGIGQIPRGVATC